MQFSAAATSVNIFQRMTATTVCFYFALCSTVYIKTVQAPINECVLAAAAVFIHVLAALTILYSVLKVAAIKFLQPWAAC